MAERTPRKAVKANEAIKVEEYYRNARFQMTRSSMRKDSCLMTNFARTYGPVVRRCFWRVCCQRVSKILVDIKGLARSYRVDGSAHAQENINPGYRQRSLLAIPIMNRL